MPHGPNDTYYDLVFVIDCTGSMGPYIKQATATVEEICKSMFESKLLHDNEDLRVGVVAYRDYDEQDSHEWLIKKPHLEFTSDFAKVKTYLSQLTARGGGDGPEALATALHYAVDTLTWSDPKKAAQAIVIITDAPPHGIANQAGDGFPKGDPHPSFNKEFSPTKLIQYFAKGDGKGIHLLVVACEPTMKNSYPNAHAFYDGITKKTTGTSATLGKTEALAPLIFGFSAETVDLRKMLLRFGGSEMATPSHDNNKFHSLFKAVTGENPSEAEVQKKIQKVYEDCEDDMDEQLEMIMAMKSPEEAIKALRVHLKDEECHSCETNVKSILSPEGRHNVGLYMKASDGASVTGFKEDRGSTLVGDLSNHTVTVKKGPLSDDQIKRLAYMYTTRFAT